MFTLDLQEHSHDGSVWVAFFSPLKYLILMTNHLKTLNLSQNVYPSKKGRNYTKETSMLSDLNVDIQFTMTLLHSEMEEDHISFFSIGTVASLINDRIKVLK